MTTSTCTYVQNGYDNPRNGTAGASFNGERVDPFASPEPPKNSFVEAMNKFGLWYFSVLTAIMYFTILYLSGKVYPRHENLIIFSSTYLVINILVNFYLCRTSKPFFSAEDVVSLPVNSGDLCRYCQIMKPPRCHHCPVCRRCIPKRDHHCFFTGVCVGERNQGYFTIYCLYCGLGLLMGFNLLSGYLSSVYYEVFSWDFYRYFPPLTLFDLLSGNIDVIMFFSVVLLCGGLVSGFFSLVLFSWQFLLICCDMTSYEVSLWWNNHSAKTKIRPLFNLRKMFGPFWILHFFIPISLCMKRNRRKPL